MKKQYEIILEFVKDLSSETADAETFIYVKENLKKYILAIDISTKAVKNKVIEVSTKLVFEDKNESPKKSVFEVVYATLVKINDEINDKKTIEKIVLCDVPNEIYPKLEKIFSDLLNKSGYTGFKIDNKIDFEKLYKQKFN